MAQSRDPIQARDDEDRDLYEIATWEPRTAFDRLSVGLYGAILSGARLLIVLLAILILAVQFALGGLGAVAAPLVGTLTILSVVPALLLAVYVWYADVSTSEPLELLVATFVLGVLFAGFAGVLNTTADVVLRAFGLATGLIGLATQIATFYVVVGPVEEAVKLLAVRLSPYRSPSFDAVVDGAVYGAIAGLGFATIENAVYITQTTQGLADPFDLAVQGSAIATVRALAGPGHVIYSAIAGYYLGLAKFNPDRAGPIVVKGLLIAALLHATYNTLVGFVPGLVATVYNVSPFAAFVGFVILYDSLAGLFLLRKLGRYRRAYSDVHEGAPSGGPPSELTEFER